MRRRRVCANAALLGSCVAPRQRRDFAVCFAGVFCGRLSKAQRSLEQRIARSYPPLPFKLLL